MSLGMIELLLLLIAVLVIAGIRRMKAKQQEAVRNELHVIRPENIPPLNAPESVPVRPTPAIEKPGAPIDTRSSAIPGASFAPIDKKGSIIIPSTAAGLPVAYHYEDVNIYTPDTLDVDLAQVDLGLRVTFRHEPNNAYDKNAVAVYAGEWKIGYMRRGKLRDMLVDWAARQQPFWACITAVDDDEREIYLCLVFYRNPTHNTYDDDADDFDYDD